MGCSLLFIAGHGADAQGNLVPNASFEEIAECPTFPTLYGFQPTSKPVYWEKWLSSPDFFNACVDTLTGVPQNTLGYQFALDGDAYIGMFTYKENYREYVGCELLEPMVAGQTYHLSFHANTAMGGTYHYPKWASNNLGMLFTMEPTAVRLSLGQT